MNKQAWKEHQKTTGARVLQGGVAMVLGAGCTGRPPVKEAAAGCLRCSLGQGQAYTCQITEGSRYDLG